MTTFTIYNTSRIRLSRWDALRLLLGARLHLATEIDVSAEVKALATRQVARVERRGQVGGSGSVAQALASEPATHAH